MEDHREIPVRSSENPYIHISPIPHNNSANNNPMNSIYDALHRCGKTVEKATKQAELMADGFWNHIKMSSSPADAAMARLVQGTKVLTQGGHDKLFLHRFGTLQGEKLLKQFACYISTLSGPLNGTLYISTKRLAFCSDYPLYHYPYSLQTQSIYYKVVIQLDQLSRVTPSTNRFNPLEKYIAVVTVDGYEFIFMGFIAYDKALNTLTEAFQRYRNHASHI